MTNPLLDSAQTAPVADPIAAGMFRDLSADEIAALTEATQVRHVPAGAILYTPDNAPTEGTYMISKGRVRIYELSPSGRLLTTGILGEGKMFGRMTIVGQSLWHKYVEAITDCTLRVISREDLTLLLSAHPRIALQMCAILATWVLELQQRLTMLTMKSVPERVAYVLARMGEEEVADATGRRTIHTTHEELANLVNANRETVTKVLSDLRARGLVALDRGSIHVVHLPDLIELAHQ